MKSDYSKVIFSISCAVFVFIYGVVVGVYHVFPYKILLDVKEAVSTVYDELYTIAGVKPEHFLQTARYAGSGVTVNKVPGGGDELIFLSGFFKDTNELRLIRRDGTIVARWPVRFFDIFPEGSKFPDAPKTNWNTDMHGAVALPDGSVVFNFEYNGLVKLDKCGRVAWTLARATHHSVERAAGGGFWVPARRFYAAGTETPFPPFLTPVREDTLLRISEDGKILSETSVPELFFKNGMEAILTSNGQPMNPGLPRWDEIVHLNKIAELGSDIAGKFPLFSTGDLALSFRHFNLLMVIDPRAQKVKWWRIGPWVRQHDPEFTADGTIILFNNNVYETAMQTGPYTSNDALPRLSNIMEIDPASDRVRILYGGRKGQEMFSIGRGKVEMTPRGGLLITEANGGRVFETDARGKLIWEYVNRYSATEVAEITEARIYPESYFKVSDWSCGSN